LLRCAAPTEAMVDGGMIHDELISAITEWNPNLAEPVQRDTPLITSARLDSMGLFQVLLWVETKLGHPLDATAIDMAVEFETVDAIVAFVERERGR
jgi:acyl carrier protein